MVVKDLFDIGSIMEWEDKDKSIKILSDEDCEITSKSLNNRKIILHVKRAGDGSEGNVFVTLKESSKEHFATSKKLLASKNILGITLGKFKNMDIEEL